MGVLVEADAPLKIGDISQPVEVVAGGGATYTASARDYRKLGERFTRAMKELEKQQRQRGIGHRTPPGPRHTEHTTSAHRSPPSISTSELPGTPKLRRMSGRATISR
jgi:hypothetical protein